MNHENYQAAMNAPIHAQPMFYVPCTRNCDPAFNKAVCKTCYPWLEKASDTNSDGSDQGIEMLTKPWEWISDMFYAGIALLGWISFVVIVGFAAGYGLMRSGLI